MPPRIDISLRNDIQRLACESFAPKGTFHGKALVRVRQETYTGAFPRHLTAQQLSKVHCRHGHLTPGNTL